ncbi:MAG TPA: ATP-dependent DNA ligase [Woeseiaceae bacterium]|nr:ATP-dependent DNA ligase [Woeseiaceae bacterium]
MRDFSRLYQELDQTTSTNLKVAAMVRYFSSAPPADAAWAVYFLSGRRMKRLVGPARLRQWLYESVDLPDWLVDETYGSVGDLAETIALLTDAGRAAPVDERSLADWLETEILPLRGLEAEAQGERVKRWWATLDYEQCYLLNKLLTGALRVGVSRTLAARALAEAAGLPRPVILHRLMGQWEPDAGFFQRLMSPDDGEADVSRPYPFCLAAPLDDTRPADLPGAPGDWQVEWKWDGIRAQLVRRAGRRFLWSRGEDLITDRFPEVRDAAEALPDGTVLDGEILAWDDAAGVMDFAALQRRIGRKRVGAKLLAEVPVVFLAYDLLEHAGEDVRHRPLAERRAALAEMLPAAEDRLRLSPVVEAADWADYAALRGESRERRVEGMMLKALDSPYGTGRQRGLWWKWKVEPHTVDAVMIYAQPGHGRRANLYTDYTFAVWRDGDLVPIAKAYSGLDNAEIRELDRWIRRNTVERFGPVRSVRPEQVFEIAFEGINASRRHKSGVALRFPRIARWRRDLGVDDADDIESVRALVSA